MIFPLKLLGKSLIAKEKAIQTAENEDLNPNPEPVFFISLVGVNEEGLVDLHEYIYDIYTKEYDFLGCSVKVINAQDLWDFYKSKHIIATRRKIDVYTMAEFFIEQHSNGHFIVDECPFRQNNTNNFGGNYDNLNSLSCLVQNIAKVSFS